VGHYNGDGGLAQGFAEAAEAFFAAWKSGPRSKDRLLLREVRPGVYQKNCQVAHNYGVRPGRPLHARHAAGERD
jgi:hypothetical protein